MTLASQDRMEVGLDPLNHPPEWGGLQKLNEHLPSRGAWSYFFLSKIVKNVSHQSLTSPTIFKSASDMPVSLIGSCIRVTTTNLLLFLKITENEFSNILPLQIINLNMVNQSLTTVAAGGNVSFQIKLV